MSQTDIMNRLRVMLVSLTVQAVVGFADYITGAELHLDVFYFIPIAITAWYLRRSDVIISAIVGALTWGYADIRGGHHYSNLVYWYWNILVSLSSLLILGLAVKALRDILKKKEAARQELLKALTELRQSSAEVQRLQGEFQVICAWTKRIRVEDKWMTIEEFLRDHLHIKLSHGMSPEAKAKLAREAEANKPPE